MCNSRGELPKGEGKREREYKNRTKGGLKDPTLVLAANTEDSFTGSHISPVEDARDHLS